MSKTRLWMTTSGMMTMTNTDHAENLMDPSRKRFVVRVGGWRPVGQYDTKAEAQEKAMTCISGVVEILERTPGTYPNPVLTESGDEEE